MIRGCKCGVRSSSTSKPFRKSATTSRTRSTACFRPARPATPLPSARRSGFLSRAIPAVFSWSARAPQCQSHQQRLVLLYRPDYILTEHRQCVVVQFKSSAMSLMHHLAILDCKKFITTSPPHSQLSIFHMKKPLVVLVCVVRNDRLRYESI